MGPEFTILSGDDGLTLPFMSVGAEGVISVASNVIPEPMVAMVRASRKAGSSMPWNTRTIPSIFQGTFH